MNDSTATYVASCHPFMADANIRKRRELARQAKKRRDPDAFVIMNNLIRHIRDAIVTFAPPPHFELAAWFGTADRLAYLHPSGALEQLGGEGASDMAFITVVGPRSYWPEAEATDYRAAVEQFRTGAISVKDLTLAAKALVTRARRREASWARDEREYRVLAAIAAWIYWDDEPGAMVDSHRLSA